MMQLLAALTFALAVLAGPFAYRSRPGDDTGAPETADTNDISGTVDADSGAGLTTDPVGAASMTAEPGGCGCGTGTAPGAHALVAGVLALGMVRRRRAR